MSGDARFWRNVVLIAGAHIVLLTAFVRWGGEAKKAAAQDITWLAGADSGSRSVEQTERHAAVPSPTPPIEEPPAPDDESSPVAADARSEIQLPPPTPAPTARATPAATPPIIAKPKPSATIKPAKKPTPKPSPKKAPVIAKATPKPKLKASPPPADAEENADDEGDADAVKKAIAKIAGAGSGGGGNRAGASRGSELAWYGSMLHDRFHSAWDQPTTVVASGARMAALVKVRIEKDGRVSQFEIVKPSGNVVVDESVASVAKKVTRVDALPTGLGNGSYYEVKINFELNPEQ